MPNTSEKVFCFLSNTFEIYLLGLFIRIGEKLFQHYYTEKLSCNRRLQENMESHKIFFLVRPQHCPPFAPPNPVLPSLKRQSKNKTEKRLSRNR